MNQKNNLPIKEIQFKINKPFIQFGKHSSQIDNAFNNFDIRENWYDFHFKDQEKINILPNITDNDFFLSFQIPANKEHKEHTYIYMNIWDDESIWRINNIQTIYINGKFVYQFDCKRDIFSEYFSLKNNSLEQLENLYILRSNFIKPSLENLKICSNACLNDNILTKFNDPSYDYEKRFSDISQLEPGIFYKLTTTSKAEVKIFFDKSKEFIRFFNSELKSIRSPKTSTINCYLSGHNKVFGIKTGWESGRLYDIQQDDRDCKGTGGSVYTAYVWARTEQYYYSSRNFIVGSGNSIIGVNGNYYISDKVNYKKWDGDSDSIYKPNNTTHTICDGQYFYDPSDGISYCSRGVDCRNIPVNSTNKYHFTTTSASVSYDSYYTVSNNYNDYSLISIDNNSGDNGWYNYDSQNQGTTINGDTSSIREYEFKFHPNYDGFYSYYRLAGYSYSDVRNAFNEALTKWISYVSTSSISLIRLSGSTLPKGGVEYGFTHYLNNYFYDYSGGRSGTFRMFEWASIKNINTRMTETTIYTPKTTENDNHWKATHIKRYAISNRTGVAELNTKDTYKLNYKDFNSRYIFNYNLPELNEVLTVKYETSGVISGIDKQVEQMKQGQRLELVDRYDKVKLEQKERQMREHFELTRQEAESTQKQGLMEKLIRNIGGTVAGVAGGYFGAKGGSASLGAQAGQMAFGGLADALFGNDKVSRETQFKEKKLNAELKGMFADSDISKRERHAQFDLEKQHSYLVSAHLSAGGERMFPFLDLDTLRVFSVRFGNKEKIENERNIFGDFINQYHSIKRDELLNRNFLMIDSNKSFPVKLKGLTNSQQEILLSILDKGVFIFYNEPERKYVMNGVIC